MAHADLLGDELEELGAIGRLEHIAIFDGDLEDARAGLRVEALEGHPKGLGLLEELVEKVIVLRRAQERVAKHAGRQGRQARAGLGEEALGRLCRVLVSTISGGGDWR